MLKSSNSLFYGRYKVLRHDSDLNFNGWKNVEMKAPKADITHHALLVSPGKPRTTSVPIRFVRNVTIKI